MPISSNYLGKAGEYAVAAQLLSREIMVHFPAVDTGVDLIAGGRVRIQVKTRRKVKAENHLGYNFTLGTKRESGGKLLTRMRAKSMADWFPQVDFLVCWGVEENKFWVIPSAVMAKHKNVQSLLLGSSHHGHIDHDRMRQLLKSGMRQCDIAREMGVHPVTVSAHSCGRITGGKYKNSLALAADKYEGAWHEIESAVRLADEIDSIDSAAARYGGLDFRGLEAEIAAETACKREK